MSDYTVAEVLEAIEDKFGEDDEFWYYPQDTPLVLRGEAVVPEKIESTGGMDEGSNASIVFKLNDQFFRKEGFYASHYGYDWDGAFYECEPKEVVVVQYVEKQ